MLDPEEYQIVGEIALKANNLEEIVILFAAAFLSRACILFEAH